MKTIIEFKYLWIVLCKFGSMEEEKNKRAVKNRQVLSVLDRIMKKRTVSIVVERVLERTLSFHLCLIYQTWLWNVAQQSQMEALKITYISNTCGVSR